MVRDLLAVSLVLSSLSSEHCASTLDVNRGRLLSGGYPQAVLSILQSYSDLLLQNQSQTSPGTDCASILTVGDLKIIKTGFGVLLNASMDYSEASSIYGGL